MKHVAIIGAGIIGAASAYALSRAGCRVTVVEAARAGGIASSASFGWLNASFHLDQTHFHLRHAAMAAHCAWAKDLPGYHHWPGCLWFEQQGPALQDFATGLTRLGYRAEIFSRPQIEQRWPHLNAPDQAVFLPEEGVIDTAPLARALLAASGAELWEGAEVQDLIVDHGRVIGLRLASGPLCADEVVIAAGSTSAALLAPLGRDLPMLPRPGVIVVTPPVPRQTDTLLCGPMGEVWQGQDGRVMIPTSPGHQGDATDALTETPGRLAEQALARLQQCFPKVEFRAERVISANRPVPGDGRPVLDRVAPGLCLAVMHSGATLAALAGTAIADLVTKDTKDPLWDSYSLSRFQK